MNIKSKILELRKRYNMIRKKGFTLVELLAVITILSIIMLMIVPVVNNVLKNSREKNNINSANTLIKAADLYYAEHGFDGSLEFESNVLDLLDVNGKLPDDGFVRINEEGDVAVGAVFDGVCFSKGYTDKEVAIADDPMLCNSSIVSLKSKIVDNNTEDKLVTVGSDLRFRGVNVNNYVTFNDESWRIIGVVNGKIKIIKNTFLDKAMPWNNKNLNDWTSSSLQIYLNGEYYNELNETSQSMIETVTYKLGGINSTDITKDEAYELENGTTVYSGRPTEISNTKIALMYPSDYAYSMSTDCGETLYNYDTNNYCKGAGTWLYNGGSDEYYLSPKSSSNYSAILIFSSGYFSVGGVTTSKKVRPVLFLKDSIKTSEGDGTEDNPYILMEI